MIALLSTSSDNLGENLLEWKLLIEDSLSEYIDSVFDSEKIEFDELKGKLSVMRAAFYKLIYKPIQLSDD